MRKLAVLLLVAAAAGGGFYFGTRMHPAPESKAEKKALYWYDPMHPSYRSDKPGIAPDCGMDLAPMYEGAEQKQETQAKVLYYRDPKAPEYQSDKPGLNPDTGNDLEPVYEGAAPGTVHIAADKQQWIGIKTGVASVTMTGETLRAPGRVVVDETRLVKVTSRTDGWIEKVYANFTGRFVKAGEAMVDIYSPELVATQQEYLLALKARDKLEHSQVEGVAHAQMTLVEAARRRLLHWGFSEADFARLQERGEAQRTITIRAPSAGYVLERKALPNGRVSAEMELFTLAALDHVWIVADVFEADAGSIRLGMAALLEPTYLPGRKVRATVTQILPQMDAQTRTLKVRLDAENPDLIFKPDLYVNAEFPVGGAARLTVPVDAVLDSGTRRVVYMDLGQGHFAPRAVETGERTGDRVEILSGLKAGERIVTGGAFLLDSESQMRGGK
jgi:membrane fusion protein, copper/silver efflux system